MTRPGHPVHQVLLDAVGLRSGMTVVDLGCGEGETLGAAATRARMNLVGLEADHRKLEAAAARLRGVDARLLIQTDLDGPCPLRDASVDALLSHNVLEYLQDPAGSIEEAGRVLVPGGTAIWSHVDFAGILDLSLADLDAWLADLEAADAAGEFFIAEPNVVVTSHKPTA